MYRLLLKYCVKYNIYIAFAARGSRKIVIGNRFSEATDATVLNDLFLSSYYLSDNVY